MNDLAISETESSLAKILYSRVRNPSVHDAGVDEVLDIIDSGLSFAGPKIGIGRGFTLALIITVVGDPVNRDERFKRLIPERVIGAVPLLLTDGWGHFDAIAGMLYAQAGLKRPLALG